MSIYVQKPGLLSTLQDSGRYGFQKYGVIASGAMDDFAHRSANLLVGNDEAEASIEMTMIGATMQFDAPALISICGADMSPKADGIAVPQWRPVYVRAGATLKFGSAREGCRCYVAVAGGFDVPLEMDSYSTYLRAGIGGFRGRPLEAEDRLAVKPKSAAGELIERRLSRERGEEPFSSVSWRIAQDTVPDYRKHPVVRVLPGTQYDLFDPGSLNDLYESDFTVQPQSDRMGYRLTGKPLQLLERKELLSEPVTFGTVQVPSDGNPIVLMADRQTTGGYPKIAQVITADLPLLAQAQIGSRIRFAPVDLKEAQEQHLIAAMNLRILRKSVHMRFL